MTGEAWIKLSFPDVIDFQEGPGILAKDFREKGVPLVRLSGLGRGASILQDCNFLDPTTVERRWSHFALRKGDILLSTSASLGRIAVVSTEGIGAVAYTGIIRMRPRDERVSAPFLRYLLEGPDFQWQAEIAGAGSVLRHFGPMHLRQMTLQLPPLPEQCAIARILGALDDKLELNQRMNETLEAMARAIFKSWFVDFDPVRAKAEGRHPFGMDAETAALFPDSFEDSTLGKIPKGWLVRSLDKIAEFLNGLALQKYPPDGKQSFPVIKIAQLRKGNTEGADRAADHLPPEYIVCDGDVLFSWSGSLEVVVWCGGNGALNQHLFKVSSRDYPKWFFLSWVREHLPEFQAIASGKATTMGHIQRHHLSDAKVLIPSKGLLCAMDRIMAPLLEANVQNDLQSRTLGETRDALLPKLISGEIRVKDAVGFSEES